MRRPLQRRPLPTRGRPAIVRGKDARLTVRIPAPLRAQLLERARVRRQTLSDVVAIALERALATSSHELETELAA